MSLHNKASTRRKIFRWINIAIMLYCLVGIAVYYLQEKFLFHPKPLQAETALQFTSPFNEVDVRRDEKTKYNIVQFTVPANTCRGVVLYFHGNKDNIGHYAFVAPYITKHGYEVWMVDYPGFGKSTGTLNEQVLYDEALVIYKMARVRFSPDSIIIYGRSLGTGIASQLASIRDCKRLILETPYCSLTSLAKTYLWMYPVDQMLKYKLPTNEYLTKVTAPISVFHGTGDRVIPYGNAVRIKQVLKRGDEFITIDGGNHNNLMKYPKMTSKLDSILSQ